MECAAASTQTDFEEISPEQVAAHILKVKSLFGVDQVQAEEEEEDYFSDYDSDNE